MGGGRDCVNQDLLQGDANITYGGGVNYELLLLHRRPGWVWGYIAHLPVLRPFPFCRFIDVAGGVDVGHGIRQKYADNVFGKCLPTPAPEDCANSGLGSGGHHDRTIGVLTIGESGTVCRTPHSLQNNSFN